MIFRKIAKKILSKSPTIYTAAHSVNFRLNNPQNFSQCTKKEKEYLTEIQKNGFTVIPEFFTKEECKKCITDIEWILEHKKEFVQKSNDYRVFGAEDLSENISKFGNNEFFDKLANAYNGKLTSCAFTLAAKIEATGDQYGSGGPWHRDSMFRQFKSMIYLSDVDEDNGPFQIVKGSHKLKEILSDTRSGKLDAMESSFKQETVEKLLKNNPEKLVSITAKAGSVVLVDTSAIHRGIPLNTGIRYALTNYFFENNIINQHLVEHFSPMVSPEKVLQMGQAS